MALVKRNGILFEEADDSLMSRVNQAGTSTPTTPAGAAAIGASPDAAKMVGSGAQRQNALKQATAPKEQTLAGQERLAGPAQAGTAEQEAQLRADRMRQLGSLRTRVQDVMTQRIAQAAPQQTDVIGFDDNRIDQALGLNADLRAADPVKQQQFNTIKTTLNSFMSAPDQATKMQHLLTLSNNGMKKSDIYALTGLTEDGKVATGDAIAAAMSDELTVGDLDVTQLGYESPAQLAELLGVTPDQLSGMTVPQIQDQYQKVQQAEYSQVQNMASELKGLPSNSARAQQIKSQLRTMGDVGRVGMEVQVQEAFRELDKAGTVKIGNTDYDINKILDDNEFSDLIQDYINASPADKDKILPAESFGNLRTWIDNNVKSIAKVIDDAKGAVSGFKESNDEWEGLQSRTGLSNDLLSALGGATYDPNGVVTPESLSQFKANLSNTGIGQLALSSDPKAKTIVGEIATLSQQERDELGINNWSAETIQKSNEVMKKIKTDPVAQGMFPDLVTSEGKFATAAQIADYEAKLGAITTISSLNTTAEAKVMNSPKTVEAISSGKIPQELITDNNADALADEDVVALFSDSDPNNNPTQQQLNNYADIKDDYQAAKRIENKINTVYNPDIEAGTEEYDVMVDKMLDAIYGPADHLKNIKDKMPDLKLAAKMGDTQAQNVIDRYNKLLDANYLRDLTKPDIRKYLDLTQTLEFPDITERASDTYAAIRLYRGDNNRFGYDELKGFLDRQPEFIDKLYGSNAEPDLWKKMGALPPEVYFQKQKQEVYSNAKNLYEPQLKNLDKAIPPDIQGNELASNGYFDTNSIKQWRSQVLADLNGNTKIPNNLKKELRNQIESEFKTKMAKVEKNIAIHKTMVAHKKQINKIAFARYEIKKNIKEQYDKDMDTYKSKLAEFKKYGYYKEGPYGIKIKKSPPKPRDPNTYSDAEINRMQPVMYGKPVYGNADLDTELKNILAKTDDPQTREYYRQWFINNTKAV